MVVRNKEKWNALYIPSLEYEELRRTKHALSLKRTIPRRFYFHRSFISIDNFARFYRPIEKSADRVHNPYT